VLCYETRITDKFKFIRAKPRELQINSKDYEEILPYTEDMLTAVAQYWQLQDNFSNWEKVKITYLRNTRQNIKDSVFTTIKTNQRTCGHFIVHINQIRVLRENFVKKKARL